VWYRAARILPDHTAHKLLVGSKGEIGAALDRKYQVPTNPWLGWAPQPARKPFEQANSIAAIFPTSSVNVRQICMAGTSCELSFDSLRN
jgi:hypothetical protein